MARPENTNVTAEELISLDRLADLSGLTTDELRTGGAAFFRRLGTSKTKLIGALVAASTASGANPQKFIRMVSNLADQLEVKGVADDKLVRFADHRK